MKFENLGYKKQIKLLSKPETETFALYLKAHYETVSYLKKELDIIKKLLVVKHSLLRAEKFHIEEYEQQNIIKRKIIDSFAKQCSTIITVIECLRKHQNNIKNLSTEIDSLQKLRLKKRELYKEKKQVLADYIKFCAGQITTATQGNNTQ